VFHVNFTPVNLISFSVLFVEVRLDDLGCLPTEVGSVVSNSRFGRVKSVFLFCAVCGCWLSDSNRSDVSNVCRKDYDRLMV
jgi:hypothetical protein